MLDEAGAAELSRRILQAVKLQGWQLGKTRVFLRAGQLALLEVWSKIQLCALPSQLAVASVHIAIALFSPHSYCL